MFTKGLSTVAVALAASTFVSAQTFTDCDPRKEECDPAPALGENVEIDFRKTKGDDYLHTLDGTTVKYDDELGAIFSISKDTEAPTKASDGYIFFGELECSVQAAPGVGIVTSIVLQSDDLDEIDWEWVGGDNLQVQTNYFSKGDTSTYDRGGYHDVANPTGEFHKYGIVWTKEKIDWTIDGNVIRTLTAAEADGGKKFPQSPMQIKIGTWTAGREGGSEGTIEWAGGIADFSKGPFIGYYKDCKIVDYMGGKKGATEYVYPDGYDGMWESVIVKTDGNSNDDDDEDEDEKKSTSASSAPATKSTAASSAESSAESSASATTLSSVVSSAASVSSDVPASITDEASSTIDDDGQASVTAEPSVLPSDEPAAGMMNRANLALGAAGLFAAFML